VVAVRLAARVSDESALEALYARCAIQIDTFTFFYLSVFIVRRWLSLRDSVKRFVTLEPSTNVRAESE